MILAELFLSFLWVGCFSFGGGYGAVSLIRDVVISHGWLTEESLTYMIAVSESTPGPIMVNMATYVGSSQAGFPGAVIATFAVVLPAFLIVLGLMILLENLLKNSYVQAALRGINPSVVGIIMATGVTMILHNTDFSAAKDVLLLIILSAAMFASGPVLHKKLSPIGLIILSAVLGVFLF